MEQAESFVGETQWVPNPILRKKRKKKVYVIPSYSGFLSRSKSQAVKLEELQILYERLNGECLDEMSVSDMKSLEKQLLEGLRAVNIELTKKEAELEKAEKETMEEEGVDERIIDKRKNRLLAFEMQLSGNRRASRYAARQLRNSTREARVQDPEAMRIKRLQLLIRQMSGKELERLNYFKLMVLRNEIHLGKATISHHRLAKRKSNA